MALIQSEIDRIVNTEVTRLVWLSLHKAAPGTTGASEVTDTSYARQQITWGASVSGVATGSQESFQCNAGSFTDMGFWDSQTGGTFLGSQTLDNSPSTLVDPGLVKVTPNFSIQPV